MGERRIVLSLRRHSARNAPTMSHQCRLVAHSHVVRQISVVAGVDPRTVVAVVEGRAKRDTVISRVKMALRELGHAELLATAENANLSVSAEIVA